MTPEQLSLLKSLNHTRALMESYFEAGYKALNQFSQDMDKLCGTEKRPLVKTVKYTYEPLKDLD